MEKKLEALLNGFTTSLADMVVEIEEATGADVIEATFEYVVIAYEEDGEDVQVKLNLGGTKNTVIIKSYEEICRW